MSKAHSPLLGVGSSLVPSISLCFSSTEPKNTPKYLVLDIRFSTVIAHHLTFDPPQPNSSISHYPPKALLFVVEITGVHGGTSQK